MNLIRVTILAALALSFDVVAAELKSIPSIDSTTGSGSAFHLDAASVKKPTLIAFWATWCESCRYEVPVLIKLQDAHGKDVDIVAVNIDDQFETAKVFIKKYGINYLNLNDERGTIADQFAVEQTPTFFVVDTKGRIQKQSTRLDEVTPVLLSLVPSKPAKPSISRQDVVMGEEFFVRVLGNDKGKAQKAFDATLSEIKRIRGLKDSKELRDLVVQTKQSLSVDLKQNGARAELEDVAKGYAIERAAEAIKARGFEDFIVRVGTNTYVGGTNNGKLWNVDIRDPRNKNKSLAIVPVIVSAASQSSDCGNGRNANKKCISVTILNKYSIIAGVVAKTVLALGPEKGMELIERTDGVEGVIVDDKGVVRVSTGLEKE